MTERPAVRDLPKIVLGVLALGALIAATAWLLFPFLAPTVWATTVVVATWPAMTWVQARLGGRRGPAVAVMVVALVALLVLPVWLGISTIADNMGMVLEAARSIAVNGLPAPPSWVAEFPLVGQRIEEAWRNLAGHPDSLVARLQPHIGDVTKWLAAKAGGLGTVVLQFLLTVIIAGILYATGESAARGVRRFFRRLAGERGENVAVLAGKAIRAVALGIVVTALAQTAVCGVGLLGAGVPHAGLLAAVAFVLCVAQVGPLLVMAPAAIWLYSGGSPVRGTTVVVATAVAMVLDNLLRPLLIKKGADLPILLILAGVLGGLMGLGILGLFVGPVLLAVAWTLTVSWVEEQDEVAR